MNANKHFLFQSEDVHRNPHQDLWVIVLRGIPRAGKTTLARALYQKLGGEHRLVSIHYDDMFEMKAGVEKDRLKPAIAMNMIEHFLKEGFNLILDYSFVFANDLKETVHLIDQYTQEHLIYFLKPPLEVVVERDKKFPVPKGIEALQQFWITIEKNSFPGCREMDTEQLSVDETVRLVLGDMVDRAWPISTSTAFALETNYKNDY